MLASGDCGNCPLNPSLLVPPHPTEPGGLMIVGEAPGSEEMIQGKPFIGRSGSLLWQQLERLGLSRSPSTGQSADAPLWVTNTVLCFPTEGLPRAAVAACRDRLLSEIAECKPKAILSLGATALSVLNPTMSVTRDRGTVFTFNDIPVVPTWHPAAVLRDPTKFRDFERDTDWLKQILDEGWVEQPPPPMTVIPIRDPDVLVQTIAELSSTLKGENILGVCDLECTELDPTHPDYRLLRVGFAFEYDRGYAVYPSAITCESLPRLRAMLESPRIHWAGHNAAFDSKHLLVGLGIDWRYRTDTMLAHSCVDERPYGHGLKLVARERYQAPYWKEAVLASLDGDASQSFGNVPDPVLDTYLGYDLYYTLKLAVDLREEMIEDGTDVVHDNVLIPASLAFRDIELYGALIDVPYLQTLKTVATAEIEKLRNAVAAIVGVPDFNPNSSKQVAELVYDVLKAPQVSGRSTAREILETLVPKYPVLKQIIEFRQQSRILSTYIDGLLGRVDSSGRVHSSYRLYGTSTGRLSSADPNLQNIPIVMGPQIRHAFIAPPGWLFMEADYSQLELRVAAYYSNDEGLIRAYREDRDIHRFVAAMMYGKPEEEITDTERYWAKYVDFGILYGRGADSLVSDLNCSVQEAQAFINRFMGQFPGMSSWIEQQQKNVVALGYVTTPTGRKRRFPLILGEMVGDVQRRAVNTPIQSLASDITVTSLTKLHQLLDPRKARIVLTVHDSIAFEVREDVVDEIARLVKETMENVTLIESPVPFKVDVEVGTRWGTTTKYKFDDAAA